MGWAKRNQRVSPKQDSWLRTVRPENKRLVLTQGPAESRQLPVWVHEGTCTVLLLGQKGTSGPAACASVVFV